MGNWGGGGANNVTVTARYQENLNVKDIMTVNGSLVYTCILAYNRTCLERPQGRTMVS